MERKKEERKPKAKAGTRKERRSGSVNLANSTPKPAVVSGREGGLSSAPGAGTPRTQRSSSKGLGAQGGQQEE